MQAGPYERYGMICRLQWAHSLVGATKSEIVALIGEPDFLSETYLTDDGCDYVILKPKYDSSDVCSEFEITSSNRFLWLFLGIRPLF